MSDFEAALLATAIVAALINWGHWRALAWLAAGVADYLVTSAYAAYGLPLHPFFTALTDATVCLIIFIVCRNHGGHKWELPLFTVFQFSVLVSLAKLTGAPSDYMYALLLELANWAALLILISTGTARLADAVMDRSYRQPDRRGSLHRVMHFVSAPAVVDSFWWARWVRQTPAH